jgi:hypothetical protein
MKNYSLTRTFVNIPDSYVEFTMVLLVGFIIHAITLWLVFPGYFDPYWPNHSDFYGEISLANVGSYWILLGWPRPLGQIINAWLGQTGVRGYIFLLTCLVVINAVGTVMLFRRFVLASFGSTNFVIFLTFGCIPYFFLVFSHPHQYTWAAFDGWAAESYTLLLISVLFAIKGYSTLLIFLTVLAAFLVKETYVLTVLFLAGIWWLGASSEDKPKLLRNLIGVFVASILAFWINIRNKSVFISGGEKPSPYHLSLTPSSICSEFIHYCTEGVALAGWILIALILLLALLNREKLGRATMLVIVLPFAGVLALLPNSLLPNHHYAGYSWNAVYLLFAPVLFLHILLTSKLKTALAVSLIVFSFIQPLFLESRYKLNDWTIEQQIQQKKLLLNLSKLLGEIPAKGLGTVLVTGLNMPFHPFLHQGEVLKSFHELGNTKFVVVSYANSPKPKGEILIPLDEAKLVNFVTSDQARTIKFDQVWTFGSNGRIINHGEQKVQQVLGLDLLHYLIFPEVAEALGVFSGNLSEHDARQLLVCGGKFIAYGQPELALRCLTESMKKNASNPYNYYYFGLAYEMLENNSLARKWFTGAVEHDDKLAPNPAFAASLRRSLNK